MTRIRLSLDPTLPSVDPLRTALHAYENALNQENKTYTSLEARLAKETGLTGISLARVAIARPETHAATEQTDKAAEKVFQVLTEFLVAYRPHLTPQQLESIAKLGDLETLTERHPQHSMNLARVLVAS